MEEREEFLCIIMKQCRWEKMLDTSMVSEPSEF